MRARLDPGEAVHCGSEAMRTFEYMFLTAEFRREVLERSAGGRKPGECRCELAKKTATPALLTYLGATDATDPKVVEHLAIVNEFGGAMHSHTNDLLFCRWDPATKTMVWDLP